MQTTHSHPWDVSIREAKQIQLDLERLVVHADQLGTVTRVAGVDVGIDKVRNLIRAAVVVLDVDSLAVVEQVEATAPATFPYVPGYLSFREIPAVLNALEKLTRPPDLLLCDGQGRAHPRRFGLACHLGVLTGLPSLGVGKSRLIGRHPAVPDTKGSWVELTDKDEVVGAVLRTRVGVKPIFISTGHRISLASAIRFVLKCTTRYRLPETTRHADRLASRRGVRTKAARDDAKDLGYV